MMHKETKFGQGFYCGASCLCHVRADGSMCNASSLKITKNLCVCLAGPPQCGAFSSPEVKDVRVCRACGGEVSVRVSFRRSLQTAGASQVHSLIPGPDHRPAHELQGGNYAAIISNKIHSLRHGSMSKQTDKLLIL